MRTPATGTTAKQFPHGGTGSADTRTNDRDRLLRAASGSRLGPDAQTASDLLRWVPGRVVRGDAGGRRSAPLAGRWLRCGPTPTCPRPLCHLLAERRPSVALQREPVASRAADLQESLVVDPSTGPAAVDVVDVEPALALGSALGVGLAALLAGVPGALQGDLLGPPPFRGGSGRQVAVLHRLGLVLGAAGPVAGVGVARATPAVR
jgi:hypothetical protein